MFKAIWRFALSCKTLELEAGWCEAAEGMHSSTAAPEEADEGVETTADPLSEAFEPGERNI
jgi:hypothetical protein